MYKTKFDQSAEYFSLENLDKLAEVDEHLEFAEALLIKYGSQAAEDSYPETGVDWTDLRKQLESIRKKQDDKKLNLSVIGEFSTGKSTFINALLRKELLASSALQGTTVASAVIDYSEHHMIHLQYLDGRPEDRYQYNDFYSMKVALERFTTDPDIARNLKAVHVYLPASVLKDEFRIIDTPGTNVTEAWHEDVTIRTLKDMSDLSIVLVSAEKPVPDTMLSFVRNHLGAILPQCVFLVTKLDAIRRRERTGLLDYVKMRLEGELELKEAVVLPYISPAVISDAAGKQTYEDAGIGDDLPGIVDDELLSMSLETEKLIIRHMMKQRTLALTRKLTSLIETMYQSISAKIEWISGGYESKLKLLERSQKTDLDYFVQQEKVQRLKHFDDAAKEVLANAENGIHSAADNARKKIIGALDEKNTLNDLSVYIRDSLRKDCNSHAADIVKQAEKSYNPVKKHFQNEMSHFEKSFKKLYESLNIIPLDMSQARYSIPQAAQFQAPDIGSLEAYVTKKIEKETNAIAYGAIIGAILGTIILPIIGSVIGFFVGGFIGEKIAPKTNTVREDCKSRLRPQLASYFNRVADSSTAMVDKYSGQIRKCLSDEMDEYLKRYRDEVNRQIAVENGQRAFITNKINDLKNDMSQIKNRKMRLETVTRQLNLLGRKEN